MNDKAAARGPAISAGYALAVPGGAARRRPSANRFALPGCAGRSPHVPLAGAGAVDGDGAPALPFDCDGMYRGYVAADGIVYTAIYDEGFTAS